VHHRAAGEIKYASIGQEATAPDPVGDRRVDDQAPQTHEPKHRGKLHSIGKSTDDEHRRDDGEGHLEGEENAFRDGAAQGVGTDAGQEYLGQATDIGVDAAAIGEGQGVSGNHP
jgi:hypothetical protein